MKNKILFLALIFGLFIRFNASSQVLEEYNPDKKIYIGLHGAMSFFVPSGVNDNLKDRYSNVSWEQGFPDIILNWSFRFDVAYVLTDYVDMNGLFELGLAPKFITIYNTGTTDFYCFTRLSAGGLFNFYFKPGRMDNYFVGAGALLNIMTFEELSGISPGLRFQFGKSASIGNINAKAAFVANIMPPVSSNGYNLNYSDIGFSMGFCF